MGGRDFKIDDLIGRPFKDEARGPDAYDCYGLVLEVFRRQGIKIPDYGVGLVTEQRVMIDKKVQEAWKDWDQIKKPIPGCLVILAFPFLGWASHFGVMINEEKFINTRIKTGVVVDRISSPAWKRRILSFHIYKGN